MWGAAGWRKNCPKPRGTALRNLAPDSLEYLASQELTSVFTLAPTQLSLSGA